MQSMNAAGMSPANMICQPPPYPYPQQQQQFWPHGMNEVPPDMPSTSSAYPPNGAPSTPVNGPINSAAPQTSTNGPQMFMGSPQMYCGQGVDGSIYPNGFHQQGMRPNLSLRALQFLKPTVKVDLSTPKASSRTAPANEVQAGAVPYLCPLAHRPLRHPWTRQTEACTRAI